MAQENISKAITIAKEVGELLVNKFNMGTDIGSRDKGVKDIVTGADVEAENFIKEKLSYFFPNSKIISEESDVDLEYSNIQLTNSWIIDPLDGTRNFSIGNPNFVVSIGYIDEMGEFSGVISYPILERIFVATDKKAFQNKKLIKVSSEGDLENAIVAFWDKREKDPNWEKVEIYKSLLNKVKVLRAFGASALEKAWVASGQVDLYIGNSSSIFGAVAGVALVRNAGGVAYNLEGEDWKLGDVGIICGNESLVRKALKVLFQRN